MIPLLHMITRPLNVILIGFMGCGKTTAGKMLAAKLGFQFVDTDELVVQSAQGTSIPEIFELEGEQGFRKRESQVLRDLMDHEGMVVSTGGGIVTQAENHDLLRNLGCIVWLHSEPDVLWERVSRNHHRPLLNTPNPRERMEELLQERLPIYQSIADIKINNSRLHLEEVVYGAAESVRYFFLNHNQSLEK